MNTAVLDTRISEFDTEEVAANYNQWFRAKVQEAIDDARQGIAHDQVMAEMDAIIDEIEANQKS